MAKRSRGQRATSVVDTVLGEAVSGTVEQRYNDMLHIASVIVNRAKQTGVKIEDVLTQRQFNAYGKALPKGVNRFRSLAEKALRQVLQNGPVTQATFYATPKATKNLPKGLKAIDSTFGHKYFSDPKNRAIETRFGHRPVSSFADVAPGPWGTGPAEAYRKAQYQRAMPPSLPAEAPTPTVRPGGLGAIQARYEQGRYTPPSATVPQQGTLNEAMQRAYAGQTLADMRTGQNMPVDPRHASITDFASIEKPAAPIPGAPKLGETITARPGSIRAPQKTGSLGSLLSSFPARPAGPIGTMPSVQRDDPAAVVAGFKQAIAQDKMTREVGPTQRFSPGIAKAPPTPTARPDYASPQQRMAPSVSDVMRSPVSPAGPYAQATGPVAAPQATVAQQRAGYRDYGLSRDLAPTTPVGRVATVATPATPSSFPARPAAVAQTPARAPAPDIAQRALAPSAADVFSPAGPYATATSPVAAPATALNPDRVKDDVVAKTPAAAAQTLQTTPEQAFDTPAPAAVRTPAQAAVRAQAAAQPQGVPGGIAGPWGADIANQPALDRTTTQAVADPAHPKGFWGKVGDIAQRNLPAIAGSLIAGPVGGLIGMGLGRAFDNARPGQPLGNPFQGLGGSLKALGMFQSGTPYAGPITHYGTGLRSISDVLGGSAPVGSRAYSRSTPGYHVTALPGGTIQKTNRFGFTSFERPSTGPTASSFPGGFNAGTGGVFSGWGGGGSVFGGSGRKSEKSEKSSGKSSGGGAGGHSKSSRY